MGPFGLLQLKNLHHRLTMSMLIAERLSARLLIVQRSRFAFVCMYIYPSHFNCVGAVSVVSSPDYCVGAVSVVSSPDC